jgi:hypothetical protein
MKKTFKYRIYPNNEQCKALDSIFEFCRFLYNCALEEKINYYKLFKEQERRYGKFSKEELGSNYSTINGNSNSLIGSYKNLVIGDSNTNTVSALDIILGNNNILDGASSSLIMGDANKMVSAHADILVKKEDSVSHFARFVYDIVLHNDGEFTNIIDAVNETLKQSANDGDSWSVTVNQDEIVIDAYGSDNRISISRIDWTELIA